MMAALTSTVSIMLQALSQAGFVPVILVGYLQRLFQKIYSVNHIFHNKRWRG